MVKSYLFVLKFKGSKKHNNSARGGGVQNRIVSKKPFLLTIRFFVPLRESHI